MIAKVSITPERIEVVDRGVIFALAIWLFVAAGFTFEMIGRWRDTPVAEASWETWSLTLGSVALVASLWWLRRLRLSRSRFDATTRRAEFEHRSLRSIERRSLGFDEIAEVVVRERTGAEAGLVRGVHVVTRSGERIDVIGVDQTDWSRFAKLADAIREMIRRPRR